MNIDLIPVAVIRRKMLSTEFFHALFDHLHPFAVTQIFQQYRIQMYAAPVIVSGFVSDLTDAVALWRPSPALCRRCCLAARRGDLPLLQNRLRLAAVLFGVGAEEVDSCVSVRADFFFDDAVNLGYFLSGCVLRQIIYAAQVLQILLDHCVKFFPAVLFDDGLLDLPHKPWIVGSNVMERLVVCDLIDVQIAVVCLDDDAVFRVDAACRAHRAICLADADGAEHIRHRFPGLIGNALRRLLHLRIPVRFRHDLNLAFLRSVRQAQALAAYFFEP